MATISQVNVNDLSYDFIDVKSRNILTEFYDGDKIILDAGDYNSGNESAIDIYNSTLGNSRSGAPSSKMAEKLIGIADRTGETRSWIEHSDAADSRQGMIIYGCHQERYITLGGGSIKTFDDNILNLSLDANCNPSVSTNGQAWRRALGFGDDINTTTISQIITPSSGITIVDAHYIERFNVAMLYLHFKYNQAISVPNHGNITNVNIGTLVEGKRPCHTPEACSNGDEGGAAWYHIETNGLVTLCAIEGMSTTRTIAANTQFNLASTYSVR